jgi:hypothetical protein
MSSRTSALAAAGLLTLGVLASACSPQALEFTIGECVNLPEGTEITDFEMVDCAEAHDAEVFALPQHPDGPDAPFPGQAALDEFAAERCEDAFEPYVGTAYADSEIYYTSLAPGEQAWTDAEDREVVCLLVGAPTGGTGFEQLTGSKEGSGE